MKGGALVGLLVLSAFLGGYVAWYFFKSSYEYSKRYPGWYPFWKALFSVIGLAILFYLFEVGSDEGIMEEYKEVMAAIFFIG